MTSVQEMLRDEMRADVESSRAGPARGGPARSRPVGPTRGPPQGVPPSRYEPRYPRGPRERFVTDGPPFPTQSEVYGPQGFNGQALAGPPVVYPQPQADKRFPSTSNMTIDSHEIMKAHMFEPQPGAPGDQYHFEKSRPSPYGITGVSDQYVVLDSYEKDEASSNMNQGKLKFNFMVQGVTRNQTIGVRDKVDTVTEIQICPFCIPIPADSAATESNISTPSGVKLNAGTSALPDPGVNGTATGLPNCDRVTMEFCEIGLQSISDRNGNRHTFELIATEAPAVNKVAGDPDVVDRLALTPPKTWDRWNFTDPIQDIHGLTVILRDGDIPLNLAKDCLQPSSVVLDATGYIEFQFDEEHGLETGDRVFIENYELRIPAGQPNVTKLKAYDSYVNGKGGLIVDTITSPTAFITNPSINTNGVYDVAPLSLLPGATVPLVGAVKVYIAKNRVRIPLRMRRIVQRLTNYETPTST